MMSDYSRTTELVSAANNSAGASNIQFQKTLDSLETKLAKLENAWNEFTMGLANDTAVKFFIDSLRTILDLINNITGAMPGLLGSFSKLAVTWAGMKSARAIFNTLISGFGEAGAAGAMSFGKAFQQEFGKIKLFDKFNAQKNNMHIGRMVEDLFSAKNVQAAATRTKETLAKTAEEAFDKYSTADINLGIYADDGLLQGAKLDLEREKVAALADEYLKASEAEKSFTGVQEASTIVEEKKIALMQALNAAYGLNKDQQITALLLTEKGISADLAAAAAKKYGNEEKIKEALIQKGLNEEITEENLAKLMGMKIQKDALAVRIAEIFGIKSETAALLMAKAARLGVIAAIGLIIYAMYKYIKSIETEEEKLKRLEEQSSAYAAELKDAKAAYDDMVNRREELDELNDKFKDLTEGTRAWKEALLEVNSQVLELVTQYPELLKYMSRGEDGILSISSEGWESVLEDQQKKIVATQAKMAINQIDALESKQKILEDELSQKRTYVGYLVDSRLDASNAPDNFFFAEEYEKLVSGNLDEFEEALNAFVEAGFLTEDELQEYTLAVSKAETNAIEIAEAEKKYAEVLANTALSEESRGYKYAKEVTEGFARENADDIIKRRNEEKQKLIIQYDKKGLQDLYKETFGAAPDDKIAESQLAEAIAAEKVREGIQIQLDEIIATLQGLPPELQKVRAATYSGDFSGLSYNELWGTIEFDDTGRLKTGRDVMPYLKQYSDVFDKLTTNADTRIKLQDLDLSTLQKLQAQLKNISGEAAEEYLTEFLKIIKEDDSLESYLSTIDWSNIMQATEAMDYMQQLGIDYTKIKTFWQVAVAGSEAYVASLEDALKLSNYLTGKITSAEELSGRLEEGKATDEDVLELSRSGFDITQLEKTADGWKLTGEQIEEATRAMREFYREQAVSDARAQQAKVEQAKKLSLRYDQREKRGTFSIDSQLVKDLVSEGFARERSEGETEEEYEDYIKSVFENLLQEEMAKLHILEETAGFAAAQSYTSTNYAAMVDPENLDQMQKYQEGALIIEQELIDKNEELGETSTDTSKILSINVAKNMKVLKNLAGAFDEVKDSVVDSKRGTQEYGEGMATILENLSKNFHVDLGEDFGKEYQEQIEKGLAGDEDAWNEVGLGIANEIAKGIFNDSDDYLDKLRQLQEKIPSEIGVVTTFEGKGFEELRNWLGITDKQIIATEENLAAFEQLFAALGGAVKFKFKKMILDPTGNLIEYSDDSAWNGRGKVVNVVSGINVTGTGGLGNTITPTSRGGGGGSSKDWENPYDWLYNEIEKINMKMRQREKLERDYQRLVDKRIGSGKLLIENSEKELENLARQKELQEKMVANRKIEMQRDLDKYSDMSKYGSYDFNTGLIHIEWDLIDTVKDDEEGSRIEEYISKLEEVRDKIWDAEDVLKDIEDQVYEIQQRGKENFQSLEDRIKQAIIDGRQKEIDSLSAINDSINENNSKLIDAMQKEIEKDRQDRENQRTEEEISEKQRRLNYLMLDTSGANDLEILKLQDEIDKAQESYTDQLIDQKISELQEQNDAAAEQRQQQINLLQAQLDYDTQYGMIAQQTMDYMRQLIEGDGKLSPELEKLLKEADVYTGLTNFAQNEWWADFQNEAALAIEYYRMWIQEHDKHDYKAEIQEALRNGDYLKAAELEAKRNEKLRLLGREDEQTNSAITGDWSGWGVDLTNPAPSDEATPQEPIKPQAISEEDRLRTATAIINAGTKLGWGTGTDRKNHLIEAFGPDNGVQDKINSIYNKSVKPAKDFDMNEYSFEKMRKKYKGYKTGGLADYTGPAWLDGTPSRPEIILNQKDSQNFIKLKDILSSLLGDTDRDTSEKRGDNYYDVDINVESIGSDYDVEQVAEKVKSLIRSDATYRNVNVASNMR